MHKDIKIVIVCCICITKFTSHYPLFFVNCNISDFYPIFQLLLILMTFFFLNYRFSINKRHYHLGSSYDGGKNYKYIIPSILAEKSKTIR